MKTIVIKQVLFIYIITIITIMLMVKACFGQKNIEIQSKSKTNESFMKLPNGIIKREIASFNLIGFYLEKIDTSPKTIMNEIPVHYCTNNYVSFTKGSTFIHIYSSKFDSARHKLLYVNHPKKHLTLIDNCPFWGTEGRIPQRKIDSIEVIIHSHFLIEIPNSAYTGIYGPSICNYGIGKKQKDKPTLPHCKAFQSEDKRRVYIYMLNGEGESRYEVTWVIQDSKYYTRVVDKVKE